MTMRHTLALTAAIGCIALTACPKEPAPTSTPDTPDVPLATVPTVLKRTNSSKAEPAEKMTPKTTSGEPPAGTLDVRPYLVAADVRAATGIKSELTAADFQGIAPSKTYGAARLRLPGTERDHFGVGLQVWAVAGAKADQRLAVHMKTYKDAVETKGLGQKSLSAKRGRVLHRSWIVTTTGNVATLTCDDRLCDDAAMTTIATKIDGKLAAMRAEPTPDGRP